MGSLLVTNDFPPKVGGIQSYLWELWRRLPGTTVLTTPGAGSPAWDAAQPFRVERTRERWLLPRRSLVARIDGLAAEVDASAIFLDPVVPLAVLGHRLRARPRLVVVHGAEVTVPGRLPVTGALARGVLREADGVVAAGRHVAAEARRVARRELPTLVVPPGVDPDRFAPEPDPEVRARTRRRFGIDPSGPFVLGVSRLVPRKGFDVLIDAVGRLDGVQLLLVGAGRDRARLERRAAKAPGRVRFAGRVPDADLPALYASADVFAMPCRDRWLGLEAEGFGIVFAEAAACGTPSVAGRSGGVEEAVLHGETGLVVEPRSAGDVARALALLLGDDELRTRLGRAARARVERELSYDVLAGRLAPLARGDLSLLAT